MGENILIGAFIGMLVAGVIVTLIGGFGVLLKRSGKHTKNIIIGLCSCVIAIVVLALVFFKKGIF